MQRLLTSLFILCVALTAGAQQIVDGINIDQLRKVQYATAAITQLYVDTINQEKLAEEAIRGMLKSLDPHSAYSNAEETRRLNEPLDGNFEGIGVQYKMLEDTLVVMQTTPKGPSEKAGILSGDRIVTVDGRSIAGVKITTDSIQHVLRGPKGTQVRLGIKREGVDGLLPFDIVRDKIPVNTVDAAYITAPGVGYIRLERFGAQSGKEVKAAIEQLKKAGMRQLILDLQQNGGGYLGAAQEVASEFLPEKSLVVFTEGRTDERKVLNAYSGGSFTKGDLVILVDEFTASAAEIVSGAVQDHDRGTIIGRRTFGKGLVQRPIELPDGSMIRLTVSHYFTPSGRCIQKPYTKGEKEEYALDFENRYKHGELTNIDSIHLDSTKVYRTLRKERIVYGGGGIMPDIFVPLDTTTYTKFYTAISRHNILNQTSLRYNTKHREAIKQQYADPEDFVSRYEVPEEVIDGILSEAKAKGLAPKDDDELRETVADLRFMLKALVAYDVWDRAAYFRVFNQRSDVFRAALEHLAAGKK